METGTRRHAGHFKGETRMKMCVRALGASVLAVFGVAGFVPAASAKAVPARTITFDGGMCTAKFVRSASGIVNETHRTCEGDQNPWIDADVRLQFRPLDGKPNPTCDPEGLVTTFVFTNTDPALTQYFGTQQYNACVYLEEEEIEEGTLDAADADGVTSQPVELAGRYQVCVTGTWTNRGGSEVLDAEYLSQFNWQGYTNGLPATDPYAYTGSNFGDVQVNGQFVDWGPYNTEHKYCTTLTLAADQAVTLRVFDGDGTTGTADASWYADNVGSLDYTITYLGP
jgi:hypothetical protein